MREIVGRIKDVQQYADLHVHTNLDGDGTLSPQEAVRVSNSLGLDAIGITEHNTLKPAEVAKNYALKGGLSVEVVIGEEITTKEGHVVGLYLTSHIPKRLSLEETLYEIHKQEGLAIIPHPFYRVGGMSIMQEAVLRVIVAQEEGIHIDGWEVHSQGIEDRTWNRTKSTDTNPDSLQFYLLHADKLGAPIASSDAHRFMVGRALTGYSEELYSAIKSGQTAALACDFDEQKIMFAMARQMFGVNIYGKRRSKVRNTREGEKAESI